MYLSVSVCLCATFFDSQLILHFLLSHSCHLYSLLCGLHHTTTWRTFTSTTCCKYYSATYGLENDVVCSSPMFVDVEITSERARERGRERGREREREREAAREGERERDRERQKETQRDKKRHREQESERASERERMTETKTTCAPFACVLCHGTAAPSGKACRGSTRA